MEEDTLLQVHLILKELQVTQQVILDKITDLKEDAKETKVRLDSVETTLQYATGFAVPVIAFIAFMAEWAKNKLLGA